MKRFVLFIAFVLVPVLFCRGQESVVVAEAIPYQEVEVKPSFNGGDITQFYIWVGDHLVFEDGRNIGFEGKVLLQFIVETDGSVSNIQLVRGLDSLVDKELVRVVSNSPKWTPGKQGDREVRVLVLFPFIIVYNLEKT